MRNNLGLLLFLSSICFLTYGQAEKSLGFVEYLDIPYLAPKLIANDTLQCLNLVIPKKKGNYPILIWIGGGAWSYVDRNQEMNLAYKLAQEGIAVASIGHRLSPAIWRDPKLNSGIQHPKHIQDVANAVKWLHDNAGTYHLDLERLYIGGYSSGGHLAALISLDPLYLDSVGLSTEIFKGILPISGTYDILNYHEVFLNGPNPELAKLHVEAVFGSSEEQMKNASPVTYLENLSAPILLICDNGTYRYTNLFEKELRTVNFQKVQVVYSHNLSHAELWKNISFDEQSNYRNIMVDFINN